MTLKARVKDVKSYIDTVDNVGKTTRVDLSLQGRLLVVAEYFDSATPNTIIHTERVIVSSAASIPEIQEQVNSFGRMVRDARLRVVQLQPYLNVDFDITDPPPVT